MKTKTFDCVEMKHRGAERVQKMLEGMSLESLGSPSDTR